MPESPDTVLQFGPAFILDRVLVEVLLGYQESAIFGAVGAGEDKFAHGVFAAAADLAIVEIQLDVHPASVPILHPETAPGTGGEAIILLHWITLFDHDDSFSESRPI